MPSTEPILVKPIEAAALLNISPRTLADWTRLRGVLRRANFTTLDFRAFLAKCKDTADTGIYCDPPFPGPGDAYAHTMTLNDHRELAAVLCKFDVARVVVRYYDVPLIRELYGTRHWAWITLVGRKQTNDAAPEVLLVRNGGGK